MNIEWNKVTWYSKLAAIVIFIGIFPALTFYIGKQYGEVGILSNEPVYNSPDISHVNLNADSSPRVTETTSEQTDENPFIARGQHEDHSVERFDFSLEIPDWMNENWIWGRFYYLNDTWEITPKKLIPGFPNGIYFYAENIAEEYNAETIYTYRQTPEVIKAYGKPVLTEIFLNNDQNIRIYHLEYENGDTITDDYYMDGENKTIKVEVTINKENYATYSTEFRKFLQGFQKREYPQG